MKYSIGEMSRLFEIPITTLRYYDKKGIFKPKYVDEENGYRYYTLEQFELLNNIINLRYSEVSLEKIKEYTENGNLGLLKNIFENQQENIRNKIEELQKIEKNISRRLDFFKTIEKIERLEEVLVEEKKEEECFILKKSFETEEELEFLVRILGNVSNFSNNLTLGNVGLIMEKSTKNLEFNNYSGIYLNQKIEKINDTNNLGNIEMLDTGENMYNYKKLGGEYLTIYFNGTREDSPKYYEKLEKYIKENNIKTEENYYEMALTEKKTEENQEKIYLRKIEIKKI